LAHVGQISGLPVHASSAGISFSAAEPPAGVSTFVRLRIGRNIVFFVGSFVENFVETKPLP
jgi:hypothetical protein